jgi:hypothetical protein
VGWPIVGAAVVLGLITAFSLRTRLPSSVVFVTLMVVGIGIAWGGLLLRPDPSAGEIVLTVGLLAVLVPFHVRIVLGPFGPRR